MSEQHWTCRTRAQFDSFVSNVVDLWHFENPLLIKWSAGEKRSLGQNALFHVWIRHLTLHMNKTTEYEYDEDAVKTYIKRRWGIRTVFVDPITGEEMPSLKSTGKYDKGEMTALMNKVEEFAACIGCTLPVWGEYLDLMEAA